MSLLPLSYDRRLKVVNVLRTAISSTSYTLLVDLSNEGGVYPHDSSSNGIFLGGVLSSIRKNNATDVWLYQLGVVLSIDATEATVGFFGVGTGDLIDSSLLALRPQIVSLPAIIDLTVNAGVLSNSATNSKVTDSTLNTTTPLPDIAGVNRTVGVGDLLLKSTRASGSGTCSLEYMLWYWGE